MKLQALALGLQIFLKRDSGTGVFLWEHLFLQNTSSGCFCKEEAVTAHELWLQNSKLEEGKQVLTTSFLGKTTS